MRLTSDQDAFGHAAWDHHCGKPAYEIIERSDGLFAISMPSSPKNRTATVEMIS